MNQKSNLALNVQISNLACTTVVVTEDTNNSAGTYTQNPSNLYEWRNSDRTRYINCCERYDSYRIFNSGDATCSFYVALADDSGCSLDALFSSSGSHYLRETGNAAHGTDTETGQIAYCGNLHR